MALCRIQLLGGLRAEQEGRVITRFQTHKTGALLAHLAFYSQRSHPREVLIEVLWPEDEPASARHKLSMALSSLRRQLEPPGVPAGAVIIANPSSLQLNPEGCRTDVREFEAALQAATRSQSQIQRRHRLAEAVELYRGELLPGYFEDWIMPERQRLAELYLQALGQLSTLLEQEGDLAHALQYAHQAAAADPLREESHFRVMRLLAAVGEPAAALRRFDEMAKLLEQEVGIEPAPEIQAFARQLTRVHRTTDASTHEAVRDDQRLQHAMPVPVDSHRSPSPADYLLPAGTLTFLLLEISRQATQPESADTGLPDSVDHLGQLRSLFRGHGGHELAAGGETLVTAFGRASDAVAAALSGLRTMRGGQSITDSPTVGQDCPAQIPLLHGAPSGRPVLQLRMALYTGEVAPGGQPQCSPALEHARRLLVAARPGQALLCEKSAVLLRDHLEPGFRLTDLGRYRLSAGAQPERLFQIEDPDSAPRGLLRPDALPAHEGNLPLPVTRFFGREKEIAQLCQAVGSRPSAVGDGTPASTDGRQPTADSPRLTTLTGPGGSGKTRLALQVARRLSEAFDGAVWFVTLVDLSDHRMIVDKIRNALHLPRSPGSDPLEEVVAFLSRQTSLLLLDNFDHLVVEGAALVQTLLERVPTLACVVSSRQRLHLSGEREFSVEPLAVPDESAKFRVESRARTGLAPLSTLNSQLSTLADFASVQLFVDRAQAARPDFQLPQRNAPAVADLCRRLDGIPLALELAAAWAQVLTPAQMLAQLERRFEFLVSRRRDLPARHQSLRAALEWTDRLLSTELQRFFARLSIFRGGWTLEAAEAICTDCGSAAGQSKSDDAASQPSAIQNPKPKTQNRTLEYLAQLRGHSRVLTEADGLEMRFRMLETLREHGAEQLAPCERTDLARHHAGYYLSLAERAEPELTGPDQVTWLDRLASDHDNLRAALDWVVEMEASPEGQEAAEWGLRLAGALWWFWEVCGYWKEALAQLSRVLALPGAQPRTAARAKALNRAGRLADHLGDHRSARLLVEESLAIRRELGDRRGLTGPLNSLGNQAQGEGDFLRARAHFAECLSIYRELEDQWGMAMALANLGKVSFFLADNRAARSFQEQSLVTMRALGDRWHMAYCLSNLGRVDLAEGDCHSARARYEEGLALSHEVSGKSLIGECLEGLAVVAAEEGRPERAARLLGAARAVHHLLGDPSLRLESQMETLCPAQKRARAVAKAFPADWAVGHSWNIEQAVTNALNET